MATAPGSCGGSCGGEERERALAWLRANCASYEYFRGGGLSSHFRCRAEI